MPRYKEDSSFYVALNAVSTCDTDSKGAYLKDADGRYVMRPDGFAVARGYKAAIGAYSTLIKAKQYQGDADHYLRIQLEDATNPAWTDEEVHLHAEKMVLKYGQIAAEALARARKL